ncbi:MAG: cbb3-type cytochrome oxidase assembly protein CcoS [Bacteroidetes bacterium]|nr:cbb3-type cytochrome oxidase assembly protein CcoS [Bacteroidota bacterium]
MSVIFFLIIIGIVVAGGFLAAFIWSVKSGQYDDDYTPSVRMLFDSQSTNDGSHPENYNQSGKNNQQKTNSPAIKDQKRNSQINNYNKS